MDLLACAEVGVGGESCIGAEEGGCRAVPEPHERKGKEGALFPSKPQGKEEAYTPLSFFGTLSCWFHTCPSVCVVIIDRAQVSFSPPPTFSFYEPFVLVLF